MKRLADIDLAHLTAAQQRVHDTILAGPRGRVAGPFVTLLHRPELCDRLQAMGAYIRFESALPDDLRELGIILIASRRGVHYEWNAHMPQALKFGIPREAIEAMARGETPRLDGNAGLVVRVCEALLADGNLDDDLYREATAELGQDQLMDLVGLTGYYTALGMCINTFAVVSPLEADPPLAR